MARRRCFRWPTRKAWVNGKQKMCVQRLTLGCFVGRFSFGLQRKILSFERWHLASGWVLFSPPFSAPPHPFTPAAEKERGIIDWLDLGDR